MEINNVDPSTIEMMQRGESVSYQFIGDDDVLFESGERIRFYGGSLMERRMRNDMSEMSIYFGCGQMALHQVCQRVIMPVDLDTHR